ncbi:ArsR/SmtB family transcription factor [Halobacterium hubeiense]|uniref:ArsR/SmtB family transcription factor n=1 Tax=Halobacterium hubeiense TaxID=1407499 RepID=UPI0014700E04|nr:winged helix-turn-helix domain-containing protein [Halobacterium hubeiense]
MFDFDSSQGGAVRVHGLVGEQADEIFSVLASEGARAILNQIHREPSTPSEVANQVDVSVENVTHHLDRLGDADLIQVAGTRYSDRGKEMTVYAPGDNPHVVFIGTDDRQQSLFGFIKNFATVSTVLVGVSVIVHTVLTHRLPSVSNLTGGGSEAPAYVLAAFLGALLFATTLAVHAYVRASTRLAGPPRRRGDSQGVNLAYLSSAVFTVATIGWVLRQALGFTQTVSITEALSVVSVLLIFVVAWASYKQSPIQAGWTIATAGYLGMIGHQMAVVFRGFIGPQLGVWVAYILLGSVAGGAIVGTVGYACGRTVKLLSD